MHVLFVSCIIQAIIHVGVGFTLKNNASLWRAMVLKCGPPLTGCVNFSFAYVEGESLLMAMKDVALSSGR